MVMLRAWSSVSAGAWLSVTRTVKLDVPAAVGVPEMTPALERERPEGSVPETVDHEYGDVPPVAASVWLYAAPTLPSASVVVVTRRSTGTVIDSAWSSVSAGVWESVARTVKFDVPEAVGVPLMIPPLLKVNPDGRAPPTVDHE